MKVHMLDRHSRENYFPDRAVKAGVGKKHNALQAFDPEPRWDKRNNWQITKLMNASDLDETDLGRFLASL